MSRVVRMVAVLFWVGAAAACTRAVDPPGVATPAVRLGSTHAVMGGPLEATYRFGVARTAPALDGDYVVFVHFLDDTEELMWTDDHAPPVPVRTWKPGATVEYHRTVFMPKFPYVGKTQIEIGVYSPSTGERLPLEGKTRGLRSYQVASFDLRRENAGLTIVFKNGWYPPETAVATEGAAVDWRWMKKNAALVFANPNRDVRFYLQVDQPVTQVEPRVIELHVGNAAVDRFVLRPGVTEVRRVDIPADRLGTAETVEALLSVDKTFVPLLVPGLKSTDRRELGIRVLGAFVQPK
jgi:hypothetical protein